MSHEEPVETGLRHEEWTTSESSTSRQLVEIQSVGCDVTERKQARSRSGASVRRRPA